MNSRYKQYTLVDFLADESFRDWVIDPANRQLAFKWAGVREAHPHLIPPTRRFDTRVISKFGYPLRKAMERRDAEGSLDCPINPEIVVGER